MTTSEGPSRPRFGLDPGVAERLRADIVAFLDRRCGNPELAADLAQEALLHVVRGLPEHRGEAGIRVWASRIAANVWYDHLRQRRREYDRGFSSLDLLDAMDEPESAAATHDARVTRDCLAAAAQKLSPEQRRALVRRDLEQIPLTELAVELDCSVGAAKVRVHRARRKLGEICREECERDVRSDGTMVCAPRVRRPR